MDGLREGGPTRRDEWQSYRTLCARRRAQRDRDRVGARLQRAAERAQLVEPARSRGVVERLDRSDQRLFDRRDADEAEDVALQRLDAVRAEVVAVHQRRHAHRHHQARRAPLQQLGLERVLGVAREREARPGHLLEKALQQRRHAAEPQRKEEHEVIRPLDRLLRRCQRAGHRLVRPGLLAAQQREVELRDVDLAHRVAGNARRAAVGVRERMAEVATGRIGVALDQQHAGGGHRWRS